MGGCPYCLGSGKVVVWKEVDRDEEMVTIQSRLETCSECNGSGFGKIETKEIYTESDVKNAFDDGYQAGLEAAQPKWISVEDELPPVGEKVLVCANNVRVMAFIDCEDVWHRDTIAFRLPGEVTHWMPLPSTEGLE